MNVYAGLLLSGKDRYSYLVVLHLSNELLTLLLHLPRLHNVYSMEECYHIIHMDCMVNGGGSLSFLLLLVSKRLPLRPKSISCIKMIF